MKPATEQERIRNTIEYLTRCRKARDMGLKVAFTTDPEWLVDMAINRRAGWLDDPSNTFGSAIPVTRWARWMVVPIYQYPKKASGDYFRHLRLVAYTVNTPRVIIRERELGELRAFFRKNLPGRITWIGEE